MDKVLVGRRGKSHHNIANSSSRTLASALVSASAVATARSSLLGFTFWRRSLVTQYSQFSKRALDYVYSSCKCHKFGVDFDSEDSKLATSVLKLNESVPESFEGQQFLERRAPALLLCRSLTG